MDLLIDTHVFLWWEGKSTHLTAHVRNLIASADNRVYVSAASIWEIAIKRNIGKLEFSGSITEAMLKSDFTELPIKALDAERAGDLVWDHRDPFDRLILAQCLNGGLTLVTADKLMRTRGEMAQIWAG